MNENNVSAGSRVSKNCDKSLPPISPRLCSCDVHDGRFVDRHVQDIEKFIHEETKSLQDRFYESRKERFGVFKKAFDMLIDECVSFKPLLANINAEYVGVIKAVEKGEQQRAHISRDLKCVVGEKITMENYKKRIQDLEYKAEVIKANNEQLRMKQERLDAEKVESCLEACCATTTNSMKQSRAVLPGLKMDEQFDVDVLRSALEKLQANVKTMQQNMKTSFSPKGRRVLLEKDLEEKERSQNRVSRYNKALRENLGRLTVAVETAKSSTQRLNKAPKRELADVILKAVNDYEKMDSSRKHDPLQQLISADDDDPLKKKESERLVSYIEHFNNLFDFAQYEAAAIHAATSPMGILRTPQAMQKFKEVEILDRVKSPLFLYCEALMTTSVVESETIKLSSVMSLECIDCALRESGLNLAIHWLNHPCIETSIPLADLLVNWCHCSGDCCCKCQALAEGIYRTFAAHRQVANTLAKQGKHHAVIEYGRSNGGFSFSDYKAILESNPTVFYAIMLLEANLNTKKIKSGISFCCIVKVLLHNNTSVLISFLEHVFSSGVYNAKGIKHSMSDLIYKEKSSDEMNPEKWERVIDLCCRKNHPKIAMEILGTLLVRQALNHASISSSLDYIS